MISRRQFAPALAFVSFSAVIFFGGFFVLHAATTYYVSPAGSDSNAGTVAAPFKTIQKAANIVNPGDTVIVQDGSYAGPAGGYVMNISRSGNAAGWITFRSQNRYGAKLDGQNNAGVAGIRISTGANYIRTEGFEVYGFQAAGIEVYGVGSRDIDVQNNDIHDIGRYCTDTAIGRDGIFIGNNPTNVTINGNKIHNIGRFGAGENGCTPANLNWQNHDHGVYIETGNNTLIKNNVFYNITRGWAVHRYSSAGNAITGLFILNNTFALPNPYRNGHIIMDTIASDALIANNVFYQPKTAGIHFTGNTFPNLRVENNITYGGIIADSYPGTIPAGTFLNNKDNTNPTLVDPAGLDFHLRSGSPAINAGIMLPQVTSDYGGVSRPQGAAYDIGAYEYISTSSFPKSGDLTGDNLVNFQDLVLVITHWKETGAPGIPGDANADGIVNLSDLIVVITNWGK